MYHHVEADRHSNSLSVFENHLRYIHQHFNVVLPPDVLSEDRPNICMVFDDAGYSFYKYVFPLLRQFDLRVLLAVSPKFILESSGSIDEVTRLGVPAEEMMVGDTHVKAVPFCTWKELLEMSKTSNVKIASHAYSHSNLLESTEVEDEVKRSKELLEGRLDRAVDSFVYPYGQFNARIARSVRRHHRYSFAVGAGDNKTWEGIGGILFRIAADNLKDPVSLLSGKSLRRYKYLRFRLYAKKWYMDRRPSV